MVFGAQAESWKRRRTTCEVPATY